MLNSDAEDWPISISVSNDIETNRRRWEVSYVSGDKKVVTSLDELRKLIGETNFQHWRMANG